MSAAELVARLAQESIDPRLLAEVAQELFRLETERDILVKRRETERENTRRYRARGGGEIAGWMRQEVFERDSFHCVDCGSEERLECDHIVPLMAGGETSLENLQTLCKPCNARKRDRIRKTDKRGQTRTKADSGDQRGHVGPLKEKTQIPGSDPGGSVGEPTDPLKELFDVGVSVLTAVGHNERQARSLIGKWRQGRSDGEVLAALVDCRTKAISNPVEWMPKRLNGGRQRDHADIVLEEASRRRVA